MSPFKLLHAAFLLLPILTAGCAGIDSVFDGKPAYAIASKKHPASQIIATWRPARGTHEGRPTRGFAGQIMFFTDQQASPALVNGKIRVYLFDDQGKKEEQSKPIRQFDFDAPSWNTYAKMSKLGPSYHIFIPYPRTGSHQANCTLSLRLVPDDTGPTLFSEEAQVTLDGAKSNKPDIVRISSRTSRRNSHRDLKPVKQSYDISRETIVPKRAKFASRKKSTERNSVRRAVAQRTADASRDEETNRVNYQEIDTDEEFSDEEFEEFARDNRRSHRKNRRRGTGRRLDKRHPLTQRDGRDEHVDARNGEEHFDDDAEDANEFDTLLQKRSRRTSGRHLLDTGAETITVDMSRLHDEGARDKGRAMRRESSPRVGTRHPLDDETTHDADEFAEFDE